MRKKSGEVPLQWQLITQRLELLLGQERQQEQHSIKTPNFDSDFLGIAIFLWKVQIIWSYFCQILKKFTIFDCSFFAFSTEWTEILFEFVCNWVVWAKLSVASYFLTEQLHCRINSHHFDIRQRRTKESPVAEHFNGAGHTLADLTVVVIDQLYSHDACLCKIQESRWIRTLGTSHPFGMNLRVDSLWNLLDNYLRTPWSFARQRSKAPGYPRKQLIWTIFEYKYVLDIIDVWSTRPEEGLTEGRHVQDSVLVSIFLHEIYRTYST